MDAVVIVLPYPPSVNSVWRNIGKGRTILSEKGRDFRRVAVKVIAAMRLPKITGRLSVDVQLFPPDQRRHDIDNRIKPILDAIQHAGLIDDDEAFDKLTVSRNPPEKPGRIVVTVAIIEDEK